MTVMYTSYNQFFGEKLF